MMHLSFLLALSSLSIVLAGNDFINPGQGFTAHIGDLVQLLWTNISNDHVNITIVDGQNATAYQITPQSSAITNKGNFPWRVGSSPPPGSYSIKLISSGSGVMETSFSPRFTIADGSQSSASGSSPNTSPSASSSAAARSSGASGGASTAPTSAGDGTSDGQSDASSSSAASNGMGAASGSSSSGVLSGGAIAGIVVGVLGAMVLGAGALWLALRCRKISGKGGGQRQDRRHHGAPLNPENLDQHLAGQEWAGIRRDVPQKQTAYQNVMQQRQQPYGGSAYQREDSGGNGMNRMSELRPDDAPGESRYGDGETVMHSEAPMTALHPASESVWHPRV